MLEEIRDEVKKLKTDRRELKKFGVTMAAAFGLLSAFSAYRGGELFPYLLGLAGAFLLIGLARPMLLKSVYLGWMGLAFALGAVMSRVILTLLFFTGMTAIGLISRMKKPDMLDERADPNAVSYWQKREPAKEVKRHLEQQF